MQIFRGLIFVLLFAFFQGCSQDNSVEPVKVSDGRVLLKIDRENAPKNVTTLTAYLIRNGYDTLKATLNLLSDSTADLSLQNIPAGSWKLRIDASDAYGALVYTGQTNVTIESAMITQISLTLQQTDGKDIGNVHILVNWGGGTNSWSDFQGNPICRGLNSPSDQGGVLKPHVLIDNDLLRMWFTNSGTKRSTIGYAESSDGVLWSRAEAGPISPGQAGAWDSFSISAGPVIKISGVYCMYYCGQSSANGQRNIGLATSVDCENWNKSSDPVLTFQNGETSSFEAGDVIKINNMYYLYYSSIDANNKKICLATSTDGIGWTRYPGNPILSADKAWEGQSICMPTVIADSSKYIMVYGNDTSANPSALGMAVSYDGINWSKDSQNPFFTSQNASKQWAGYVWNPCLRKINNEWLIYYTGYNKHLNYGAIGLLQRN